MRTANSEISDALLSLMVKPFMGKCVNMRNTENSEIRILVRIDTNNKLCSHDDICLLTIDTKMGEKIYHILCCVKYYSL